MPDTFTNNLNLTKPEVGASRDTWGTKWNNNADLLDGIIMQRANNLSDLTNLAQARANLGVAPSTRAIIAGAGLTGGGNLTEDRTISLADGGLTTAKIANKAITLEKLEDMPAGRLIGRPANAGTGSPQHLTPAEAVTAILTNEADGLVKLDDQGRLPPLDASQLTGIAGVSDASTTQKGVVQLTNSTTSTSQTLAATALAVKTVQDAVNAVTTWPGAYTGTARDNTNFPIGTTLMYVESPVESETTIPERNGTVGPLRAWVPDPANSLALKQYVPSDFNLGPVLSGTWRSRGANTAGNGGLAQRVA